MNALTSLIQTLRSILSHRFLSPVRTIFSRWNGLNIEGNIFQLRHRFSLVSEFQKLVLALAILCCLWFALYLPHLRISPGWYSDEFGVLINGNGILDHSFSNRALHNSFFSVFANYQPIASFLFAFFSNTISDGDIVGARFLSTLLAILIAAIVCITLARRGKLLVGFSAALTILAAPQCVIHFRWAYPHYFVSLGVIIIGLMLDAPRTKRRDWIIGMGAAIAAMGHLLAVHVTLGALLARIRHRTSWTRIIIPPAVVWGYSLFLGYSSSGLGLFADLQGLASLYAADSKSTDFLHKILNIWNFFSIDWFHLLLLFSFLGITYARKWALLVFSALTAFAVIQNRPLLPVFYYQAMVFIPLLCVNLMLSLDVFCSLLCGSLHGLFSRHWYSQLLRFVVLLLVPVLLLPGSLKNSFLGSWQPRNASLVASSCYDLEQTAAWINQHTNKEDFVVAYWDSEWLLRCRSTDIAQCAAWRYGICSPTTYNRKYSREEFLWPADITRAKYVFVSPIDLKWTYWQGTVPQLIQEVGLFNWPIVYKTETTFVVQNPAFIEKTKTAK